MLSKNTPLNLWLYCCRIATNTPAQIKEALAIIDGAFETEASGGINLDNLEEYAQTGVDYVSVGALIHQAKSLDLSLKAVIV